MKNKILKLSLIFLSVIGTSCSNDEQNFNSKDENQQKVKLSGKDSKEIVFKEVPYNSSNKQIIMDASMEDLLNYIYFDLKFNSDIQEVTIIVNDNKMENSFTLSYDLHDLNLEKTPTGNITFAAGKEKLQIHCSGGKNDGKYKIVDKPTSELGAKWLAIRLNSFFNDCLDNGGCIEVCTYSATIKK
ncbi:hypothetical protein QW060_16655 [Myroides ceti]|uniref:Lipoprotein n=1 Tax=Paenimyroides ceti TaxID=395087 RepID=A0ABT8CX17_9FLAO|nr:hypothetical protein [Paenimyroides ceti]MDN3708734.1 hypothetical protein [Paenimyroides ceti]